MNFDVIW